MSGQPIGGDATFDLRRLTAMIEIPAYSNSCLAWRGSSYLRLAHGARRTTNPHECRSVAPSLRSESAAHEADRSADY